MLQGAQQRVKEGVLVSDRLKEMQESKQQQTPRTAGLLRARQGYSNPVLSAEVQYVRDHGQLDYDRMMMRLFEEFFPKE